MTADDYSLELDLFRAINPEKSSYKATPSKVEISLGKIDGTRWDSLEKKKVVNPAPVVVKKKPEDWDKFAKEVEKKESEEEKVIQNDIGVIFWPNFHFIFEFQGEEALQALFRKIYESSSEETKRAMNKSFQESQGTVLSTNWKEVGKQQVDIKPPDGVEFKKWDE